MIWSATGIEAERPLGATAAAGNGAAGDGAGVDESSIVGEPVSHQAAPETPSSSEDNAVTMRRIGLNYRRSIHAPASLLPSQRCDVFHFWQRNLRARS